MPYRTKEQQAECARSHYQRNKRLYIERAQASEARFIEWFKHLRDGLACQVCGETHPACLDFHHRDPEQKLFNIAAMRRLTSRKKVLAEIEKCDVLCANCHRKLHYEQRHS